MVRVTGHRLSRHLRSHAKNLEDNDNGSCGDRSCIWAMSVVAATKTFPEIWGMSHSGRTEKYDGNHMPVARCLANVRSCPKLRRRGCKALQTGRLHNVI